MVVIEVLKHFEKGMIGTYAYAECSKTNKNFRTYSSKRRLIIFRKNLIVMTKIPDIGQMAKTPRHFLKIP